jgi:putative oxidoreductase
MLSNFCRNVLIPLLLRFALAAIFIYHGLQLVQKDGGANWMPEQMAQPAAVQIAVAWGELLGGVAMALGFLTRIAALGLIAIMAGAVHLFHLQNGFDITNRGYEYNMAIMVMCLCLVLGGPGPLAVDRVFRLRARQQK